MDIDNLNPKMTLERQALGYSMRQALRRERAFYTTEHRVFVLIKPEALSLLDYQLAASLMLKAANIKERYLIVTPDVTKRGGVDFNPVRLALEKKMSVLVLVEPRMEIPRYVIAAADSVREIGPLKPHHLAAATKAFHAVGMTKEEAAKFLEYPLDEVFASIRPDRPISQSLERLEASHRGEQAHFTRRGPTHRLETLSGYGDARRWGLNLATDLAQWKTGALEWRDVDTGVLLSGPPGTGKTLFASALAATCGVPLIATSAAQWQATGYLNDMLAAMRKSFSDADSLRPSILFIDEIDSIGDRTKFSGHNRQYNVEVVNALLECMDGTERREGVVVVGATNDANAIDAALRRSGRLDSHFELHLPDFESRKGIALTVFDGAISDAEAGQIAAATEGFSGADFVKLARDARRSTRSSSTKLGVGSIISMLPPPNQVAPHLRRRIAIHEVGHAVVGLVLEAGKLESIQIADGKRRLGKGVAGLTAFEWRDDKISNRQWYLDQIAIKLGGMAAESVFFDDISTGSGGPHGSDLRQATALATGMETQYGMGEGLVQFEMTTEKELNALLLTNPVIHSSVESILQRELVRAKKIVASHRHVIELASERLSNEGFLDGAVIVDELANSVVPSRTSVEFDNA